jgi:ribosomal RNA assembly protein
MTEKIYTENIRKILSHREEIENAFKIKIDNENKVLIITGNPVDELTALSFVEAIDLGFSIPVALDLKNEDFIFKKINIKSIATRTNLSQIRARIIGKQRKAMDNFEFLSDCSIALHKNNVGLIGHVESVNKAEYAMKHLIAGSKHANVYAYLEKEKAKESF